MSTGTLSHCHGLTLSTWIAFHF